MKTGVSKDKKSNYNYSREMFTLPFLESCFKWLHLMKSTNVVILNTEEDIVKTKTSNSSLNYEPSDQDNFERIEDEYDMFIDLSNSS